MFSTTLNEDIREIQEQIDIISEKIGDPDFCEKVKMFVIAPLEIQQIFKTDAGSSIFLSPFCLSLKLGSNTLHLLSFRRGRRNRHHRRHPSLA